MKLAVFGSSGCAREVADIAWAAEWAEVVFIDRYEGVEPVSGLEVYPEEKVGELREAGYTFSIGIGDNALRKKIRDRFPTLPYATLIHPAATFGRHQKEVVEKSAGTVVAAGVRFTNNIRVGDFGCFNLNCTVSHDVVLGDFVQLAPGAGLSGNVIVEEGVWVGAGAVVIQGRPEQKRRLGAYAVIGAGAVVTRDVGPGETVKGVPAK